VDEVEVSTELSTLDEEVVVPQDPKRTIALDIRIRIDVFLAFMMNRSFMRL